MPLKEFGSHVFIETLQSFRNRLHGQLNKRINLVAQTLSLGQRIKFLHKVPLPLKFSWIIQKNIGFLGEVANHLRSGLAKTKI
jgi:hypothetical protein